MHLLMSPLSAAAADSSKSESAPRLGAATLVLLVEPILQATEFHFLMMSGSGMAVNVVLN